MVCLLLVLFFFFFFKQKTAYEMRISDWSSDVCSSDLNSPQRRMAATTGSASATHLVQLGSFSSRANAERATEIYKKRYSQLDGRDMVITQEIGRASCRERVCPYV